jgi:prepilin-type N-terminal cleavage/methylation domain-containing protein
MPRIESSPAARAERGQFSTVPGEAEHATAYARVRGGASPGFSLIEVMVAAAILGCAVLSIAQLAATATSATASARGVSEATLLAWQTVDELRSLAWAFDDAGVPVSDAGLAPSPAGALSHDADGCVDYLDAWGQSLGGGALGEGDRRPRGTRYRRRWAVVPSAGNPDLLILRVRVLAAGREEELAAAASLRARRRP